MEAAFEATTSDINVRVRATYLAEQSKPEAGEFVWAYHVAITNQGTFAVQLLSRFWRITDALGRVRMVQGEGVVGQQPVLEPGECYEYSSGCPLNTPSGFMQGHYHMQVIPSGSKLDVAIPAFSLDSPHQNTRLH